MAEQIREIALEGVRDEVPHSLAVVIDEMTPGPDNDDLVHVHAISTSSATVRRAL